MPYLGAVSAESSYSVQFALPQIVRLSEPISFTDNLSKNIDKFLSDSITTAESIVKRDINKVVSDTITVSEGLSKSVQHYISDALSIVEGAIETKGKPQPLNLQFLDTITMAITKVISVSDSIVSNEFSGKELSTRPISDALSMTDIAVATKYRNFVNSVIDTLNAGDSISKGIARKIIDTPGMIDNLAKGVMRMVSDGIVMAEVISLNITSILLEQTRTIRPKATINIDAEGTQVDIQ